MTWKRGDFVVGIKLLSPESRVPRRATSGAAGYDLFATEQRLLAPGEWHPVATGVALEIPRGYEGQIRPRSGLAAKHGITVLNVPGTIDSDYRGEVKVILVNHGQSGFSVDVGMRIAQIVFAPVECVEFDLLDDFEEFDDTERGTGGFGHTGV